MQGCILQTTYRQAVGVSVPCPVDSHTPEVPWFDDHIAAQVPEFASVGITALLLSPDCKTASGTAPGGDGYGLLDYYDVGSKDQAGGIPTRFGHREQRMRLCALIGFYGLKRGADWIMHQVTNPWRYPPNGQGRFPKQTSYFWKYLADGSIAPGYVGRDNIAGPPADDYPFANPFSYQNSTPKGVVMREIIAAYHWLKKTFGIDFLRDDDTKGQSFQTVNEFTAPLGNDIVIGEYDDGNAYNVDYWVKGTNYRRFAWDFPLHYVIEAMCNSDSDWPMWNLVNSGYVAVSNANAVTFVENPDTDTDGFGTVIWKKTQGYFLIMTFPGYPCIYYKDYSTDKGCYGLKPFIDNYLYIHRYAEGNLIWRVIEFQYVVYEREGNLICGINNDRYNGWITVTAQTAFGPNVHCHDLTGNNAMDCWTDESGRLTFGIPPGHNGRGLVAFVRADDIREIQVKNTHTKTMSLIGGPGLDIPNVKDGTNQIAFRIFGTPVHTKLICDETGWNATTKVTYDYIESTDGYTSFVLNGFNLPSIGSPFELEVTFKMSKAA